MKAKKSSTKAGVIHTKDHTCLHQNKLSYYIFFAENELAATIQNRFRSMNTHWIVKWPLPTTSIEDLDS